MKRTLHIIAAGLLSLTALLSASCTKDNMTTEKEPATRQITITPEIGRLEAEVITRSGNTDYTIGECDIYCFVFDRNNEYSLMEGYPKKQDSKEGSCYTFTIPELENASILFAIYPETVSFQQINYRYDVRYHFISNEPSNPSNTVYTSKLYTGNTSSENGNISLDNIVLEKYNFTAKMMFDFSNISNIDDVSGIYINIEYNEYTGNSTSTERLEHQLESIPASDLYQETEDDKTYYCTDISMLCISAYSIDVYAYMKNGDYYSSNIRTDSAKNMEIKVTLK